MIRLNGIKIPADKTIDVNVIGEYAQRLTGISLKEVVPHRISIDARKKDNVFYYISANIVPKRQGDMKRLLRLKGVSCVEPFVYTVSKAHLDKRPVVVGFGPAGMFAALVLAKAGACPIVIEQGKATEERTADVRAFFEKAELNERSNVQFGEGGAGTFSDGKLNTGIKDERCSYVLDELASHGAPESILYDAKPHIGTDKLRQTVVNIRKEIIALGGEVRFNTRLTGIGTDGKRVTCAETDNGDIETDGIILAIGHSARSTFKMLTELGIKAEQKSFAVGVRIEHEQGYIDKTQYGKFAKYLPPADYKLFTHLKSGRGVYTFCMCPGGSVVAAASEKGCLTVNGMSMYLRDGKNANSALLVGIDPSDFGSGNVLAGIELQRKLERNAYEVGGGDYKAPVQSVGELLNGKFNGCIEPTYPIGVKHAPFDGIFPEYILSALKDGVKELDNKLHGFADEKAVMTAVESRSSSPVRILRDENCRSLSLEGLYPCGEGCGYAGGIMSAAVDGMRCAEALLRGGKDGI